MDNKNSNNKIIMILVIILLLVLIAIIVKYFDIYLPKVENTPDINEEALANSTEIQKESTILSVSYEETKYPEDYMAKITLNENDILIDGTGVINTGNEIRITSGGSFYLTGTSQDANIVIEVPKEFEVQLVLDNLNITSKITAPINCISCKNLIITSLENSKNTIIDPENYTKLTNIEKQEPNGAIFTKTDLLINGTGTLIVNSNFQDGIVSKDTMKIVDANIEVNSKDDGIRGKDYLAIKSSNITVNSKGDGIKSTNEEDEALGFIKLDGGNYNIISDSDGMQAETIVNISNNPVINITSNNNKGIKSGTEITIDSGDINIISKDDAIHTNGFIIINKGNFKISSDDDGIHADTNIIINDGNINIDKSYEGIESSYIEINGGKVDVASVDDGINVAGGKDASSLGGRPGQNNFSNMINSNLKLVINGGDIIIDAIGDGLDSNGSIYMYGGNVLVKGPTSNSDAPLDFEKEMVIDGGNLIAYGSSGMFENPSTNSKQNIIVYTVDGNPEDKIEFKDSNENVITEFETDKKYKIVIISNSNIRTGESYTVYVNNEEKEKIEINSVITSNGNNFGGGMKGGKGSKR